MMQNKAAGLTQCELNSIEGGKFGAYFGVLAKGLWLHNIDIYIQAYLST